jgi:1,4-dihydroxy-2-naphthoyl-CoA hydrolase
MTIAVPVRCRTTAGGAGHNGKDTGAEIIAGDSEFLRVAEPVNHSKGQQLWQEINTRSEDSKEVARAQVRLQNVPLPS